MCIHVWIKMSFSSKEKRDMLKLHYRFDKNTKKTDHMYL